MRSEKTPEGEEREETLEEGVRQVVTFEMFKKKWKGRTLHSEEQVLKQERNIYCEVSR